MVTTLTQKNHKKVVEEATKPVIIDVYATWCGPCIQMKPFFEKLAEELGNSYVFAMINIDESRDLAIHYSVTSVPTIIFIKNNKVVAREIGYMPINDLREKIQEYVG